MMRGFTLPELLITVTLVAITLAIGLPSMKSAIQNTRRATHVNALVTDVKQTRNEAIARGEFVVICRRNAAGTACGGNGGHWEDGWIIFVDQNRDGVFNDNGSAPVCELNAENRLKEDCLLKRREPLESGTLRYPHKAIVFDTRGFAAGYNGTFTFCDVRGNTQARYRTLQNSGRLAIAASGAACP